VGKFSVCLTCLIVWWRESVAGLAIGYVCYWLFLYFPVLAEIFFLIWTIMVANKKLVMFQNGL